MSTYPQNFDKQVRAVLDAYSTGHVHPTELRDALRQAGMPLDPEKDELPPVEAPYADYDLTEEVSYGDPAAA